MKNKQKIILVILLFFMVFDAYAQNGTVIVPNSTQVGSSVHIGLDAGVNSSISENIFIGYRAGRSASKKKNVSIGNRAGSFLTGGQYNTFLGSEASRYNTTGGSNTSIGCNAGRDNKTGGSNTCIGNSAGLNNKSGNNTFIGKSAGQKTNAGSNTLIGSRSFLNNSTGANNTVIGFEAGYNTLGSGNVFLGHKAGWSSQGDNKLYIANSPATTPLIYGDFTNGKVGIGTTHTPNYIGTTNNIDVSDYHLYVKGGILTEEVRVRTGWADYVFEPSYKLMPLEKVESFIQINGHLPDVPSAKVVEEEGISLGEISKIQQQKIEELTLYTINQQKQIDELKKLILEFKISKND